MKLLPSMVQVVPGENVTVCAYCKHIAPGKTECTCRKVGARQQEAQGQVNHTPAYSLFRRGKSGEGVTL